MAFIYGAQSYDSENAVIRASVENYDSVKRSYNDKVVVRVKTTNANESISLSPPLTYEQAIAEFDYSVQLLVSDTVTGVTKTIDSLLLDSEIEKRRNETYLPENLLKYEIGTLKFGDAGAVNVIIDSEVTVPLSTYHQIKDDDSDYAKNIIDIQNQIEELTTEAVNALEAVYDGGGDSDLVASLVSDLETVKTISRDEIINKTETKLPYKAGIRMTVFSGYWGEDVNHVNNTPTSTSIVQDFVSTQPTNTTYQYKGYLVVSESGYYKFSLRSDDAGHVWIGSNALSGFTTSNSISKHPGLHPIGAGGWIDNTVYLEKGFVPFRAIQGNEGGGGNLIINITKPDGIQINMEDKDVYGNMKHLKYKAVDF